MFPLSPWAATVVVGIGATAVLDLWLWGLKRLGVPTGSFALVGRWVAHMPSGRFRHPAITRAEPMRHELALGWAVHYAVGIAFAAALVAWQGVAWVHTPRLGPALLTGVATVALPLCVMQPAMGQGLAASRTPTPLKNVARSVANHTVFGVGLYLAAVLASHFTG